MRIGMGEFFSGGGGIAPGGVCYDPTHDPGMYHCAAIQDVIASAFNAFSPGLTTNCSDAEESCLAGGAPPVGSTVSPQAALNIQGSTAIDPCTNTIGISCSWLATGLIVGAGILLLASVFGGKRR